MDELRETVTEYAVAQPPAKMSLEEFIDWCDEDTWAEWVDGEVIVLTPASAVHQDLHAFLSVVMRVFVRYHQYGKVLYAPFAVHLPERLRRVREPDILFFRQEHLSQLKEASFEGSPDVIVEIISSASRKRDRQTKYAEYEAAMVQEYWLIDPERRKAEFYRLGTDGRFHPAATDEDGTFRSEAIPRFWLKTDWLWQDPLPLETMVLKEMGVF